jgi:hypothetical protein
MSVFDGIFAVIGALALIIVVAEGLDAWWTWRQR